MPRWTCSICIFKRFRLFANSSLVVSGRRDSLCVLGPRALTKFFVDCWRNPELVGRNACCLSKTLPSAVAEDLFGAFSFSIRSFGRHSGPGRGWIALHGRCVDCKPRSAQQRGDLFVPNARWLSLDRHPQGRIGLLRWHHVHPPAAHH